MAEGETGDPQADDEPVPMEEVLDVIFADQSLRMMKMNPRRWPMMWMRKGRKWK